VVSGGNSDTGGGLGGGAGANGAARRAVSAASAAALIVERAGERDELDRGERLRAPRGEGVRERARCGEGGEAVAEHLPPLPERRPHHPPEGRGIYALGLRHSETQREHGALDVGPGAEDVAGDAEEELGPGEELELHAKDAVGLRTRRRYD